MFTVDAGLNIIVPFAASFLYRAGGTVQWPWCPINQKLWRWLMGGIIGLLIWKASFIYIATIASYFIATNIFSYGEKSPILKHLSKPLRFLVSGLMFGLASIPLIGLQLGLLQGLFSSCAFLVLMYLDDTNIIKNPWQELLRGFLGTSLYFFY
jgi:hypothetical protein